MTIRITILCENSVARPGRLIGEHGFAALIETPTAQLLFDTGQGLGLIDNAQEIGRDLHRLDGVVLSHGHYDHSGGLQRLLGHLRRPLRVHGHPELFAERYWKSEHELRAIGIPKSRSVYAAQGAQFCLEASYRQLGEGIYLSGEVPRVNAFERGDAHLVVPDGAGGFVPDPLRDDQSLAIRTGRGLVVLLGCAHAGVVNILDHLVTRTGEERICALIGGTHLGPVGEEEYHATVAALKRHHIERIGVAHCTGLNRGAQLHHDLAGRFSFAAVGTTYEFPA